MRRAGATVAGVALVACAFGLGSVASSSAGVRLGAAPAPDDVQFPAGFEHDIFVGGAQVYTATTTGEPSSTSTAPTSTTPAPSTSSSPSTTTTTTTRATTTTAPGTAGAGFSESFADPTAFATRFDHGWSGELHAGALFGADRNDYMGDHDGSCGDPNHTGRTVHIGGRNDETGQQNPSAAQQAFYTCLPGGDPAKGHVMTAVDTEGYVVAWFSPKGTFNNVHRVCWDQSEAENGGGNWTQVVFLTPTEYAEKADLGYTSPEFPNNGGPSVANGTARFGVKDFGSITAWADGKFTNGSVASARSNDHAPRFQRCVTDNENGTLGIAAVQPNGTIATGTIGGQIPNGPIRVVFEHDTYNPAKHYNLDTNDGKATAPTNIYTWHWDNVLVQTG